MGLLKFDRHHLATGWHSLLELENMGFIVIRRGILANFESSADAVSFRNALNKGSLLIVLRSYGM
jgi:hypothetical protein